MSEKEPLATQEQPLKEKWIPVLWDEEKRELLEKLPISELFLREEIIKNELTNAKEKDQRRFIELDGNILQKNSIGKWAFQLGIELKMIDTIINERSRTIEDTAKDESISYDSTDILGLYKLVASDSTTTDSRAAYGSLKWHVDIAKSGIQRWWNLDAILEKLKIPKDNPKYRKIIAKAFIGEQLDSTESSSVVANTTFDTFKRGIEELSVTEKITFTNIYQRLSQDNLALGEDDLMKALGSWENYKQTREKVFNDLWIEISEGEYNILIESATKINTDATDATARAQENQGAQVTALKKWNLVEALQQETKYQRETSQIEYYRDLRSSLSKTEWNQINSTIPTSKNNINVGGSDFSTSLTYFMNDERTNSIYPKLSDGTTIPIIKAWDDVYIVQGCQVPADEVEWLVKLNQTLAEKGLRFFSTKSPLTKILTNIEQTLRTKGVQNVPYFWDLKNVSTYQDNIVDILYSIIDPDPKTPSPNVNERIDLTSKRLKNGIPLIAHGRQSWIVREDSSIDLDKIAEKLTTVIQSGYPFMFWGDKKERG
jgi:hypothetical protein